MQKVSILHLITSAKNASPFDVNMAFDAGFDKIMPYINVELDEVSALTQDAIFSRSSSGLKREAIFIGGRDMDLAMDMLEAAKKATFPPFEISLFADPSGAFTTAAAMLAKVEFHLKQHFKITLKDKKIAIFGATGPVGGCVALIAAKQGAQVQLVAHRDIESVREKAQSYNQRYGVDMGVVDGVSEAAKQAVLDDADVALCCAAAGVRVISAAQIAHSTSLKIIADVNAVPPSGAEGAEVMMDGVEIAETKALGIGALAIGNLKYATQHQLLKQMLSAEKPVYLEFMSAFETAQNLASS
ncbi:MAG: NAD(P)-dependent methylenetetrahydromethanopterin dehydrogenase [Methylotenera sp.]